MPVGVDDIGLFEHGLGRQHDVGLARGVGEELVDHDPEVESPEGLEDGARLRVLGHRVAALDPRHPERRIALLQHRGPEPGRRHRHPDGVLVVGRWVEGEGILDRVEDVALQVGVDPPGSGFAEVAGERQERDEGAHGLAGVGVALHPVARADGQRGHRADHFGQPFDHLRRDIGDLGHPLGRVASHHLRKLGETVNVGVDERPVDRRPFDQEMGDAEGERAVGTGTDLHQQLRAFRRLRPPRIDDDHPRPALHGLLDESHLVDVGLGRILAPEDDEAGVDEVPGGIVLVVPEGEPCRLEPGRPAEIAIGRGAASEQPPEVCRQPVHQTLGAAGLVEEDAARTVGVACLREFGGDPVEGHFPGNAFEAAVRGSLEGVEQPLWVGDPFDIGQPFEAHTFGRRGVAGVGLDRPQPPVLDRDPHTTRGVAVAGARRREHVSHVDCLDWAFQILGWARDAPSPASGQWSEDADLAHTSLPPAGCWDRRW